MSLNNSIINLLNLKDKNIIFTEDFYSDEIIDNVEYKVFKGKLTYTPDCCYNCGHIFDNDVIKYGFKLSTVKLPKVSNFDTYLKLNKQRYFCKHCNSTFILKTNIVDKNCYISNNTKLSIALKAVDKISEKDIAKNHNVSNSTVSRVLKDFYSTHKPNFSYLPKNLCFDEFKSTKSSQGAMSFIFCDSNNGEIVDIVESRTLTYLTNYFLKYSIKARKSVETIVIDMYSPYMSLIKDLFPNANIIIDKFHIIQHINRALNQTRINLMNNDKKNYNKLKKYWKLILKDCRELDHVNYHYRRSFKKPMSEGAIMDYLLSLDTEFKSTYELYQNIKYAVSVKDENLLDVYLSNVNKNVSEKMRKAVSTLNRYKKYLMNTVKYNYTNGVLEGINNKIKVIKRIAFGYRNFYNFRSRIFITQNLAKLKA